MTARQSSAQAEDKPPTARIRPASDPALPLFRDISATLQGHYSPRSVAKADSRIAVTVNSGAHRVLLEWWATYTGRTVANLVSYLLEKAIVDALRDGEVPQQAVECMDKLLDARSETFAEERQQQEAMAKQSGLL